MPEQGAAASGTAHTAAVSSVDLVMVPAADAVTFSLLAAPQGMTIAPQTGLVTWKTGGNDAGAHDV